ncbi:MAG: diphosphate--fructose-6-phosphate 1-phosphotransferase, partial [Betaproteobacteria bacterium]|nr:diphosphate--fructose-6-phosphate 1-phosphotransferase [Betaproteobacteria bacterium]
MSRPQPCNAIYAQAGGATAVINASAAAIIEETQAQPSRIRKLYAARDGLLGVLAEDLVDTSKETAANIRLLAQTPGSAFGTCRAGLDDYARDRARWERIFSVLRVHEVGYVFYNGGNGSCDTAWKLSQMGLRFGYPLTVVGVPKTIDNDIVGTDTCPGFGSAAKYLATCMREAAIDLASMASTSTRVFVLEVMGRNAGWLTAACGLAAMRAGDAPQVLLFPEQGFDEAAFLSRVK